MSHAQRFSFLKHSHTGTGHGVRRTKWTVFIDKQTGLAYKLISMQPDQDKEEKLAEILYPDTQAKTFKITLVFGYRVSPAYATAVGLAKKNPTYKEEGSGDWVRHSAAYTPEQVEDLFELFTLIHDWDGTEVLVNHKKIPYGHQLWLPLMWFYRIK